MKKLSIILILLVTSLISYGQGITWVDISYKVVLNPANGARPTGVTNADIQQNVVDMNALMEPTWRGIRFRITEIVNVGGKDDAFSQKWYNTNISSSNKGSMESDAKADAKYAWRNSDINIYINQGEGSAICSFPGGGSIIVVGGHSDYFPARHIHEIGHYFNLCHTQGCPCGSCDADKSGTCHTTPGSDDVPDTLPDLACWNQNNIAQNTYGSNYASLTSGQQNLVDNVFNNIMSYHSTRVRLTEGQLDRWTDAANGSRDDAVNRRTIFVAKTGGFIKIGTSGLPFTSAQSGVNAAPSGGLILLKPGAYDETFTINKAVSLRATRSGVVTIGDNSISLLKAEEEEILASSKSAYESLEELGARYENGAEAYEKYHGYVHEEENQEEEIEVVEILNLYPNPNYGIFALDIDPKLLSDHHDMKVVIFNMQGEAIFSQKLTEDHLDIDLSTYSKGVYYVKLSGATEETLIKKLVYQ